MTAENKTNTVSEKKPEGPIPHIGSFVLETLTLGMYGDPRHTLREYVQNAFDSLRSARRTRLITTPGRVLVTFEEDAIKVFDNGPGIPAAQAWSTLTSIGASKKERKVDAGFRGIGRLAGMAYCKKLVFRTRFPGDETISIVTFDCQALMAGMSPDGGGDAELSSLLAKSITRASEPAIADGEPHFFEVTLQGLEKTHPMLLDVADVTDYLRETSPVPFDPTWRWAPIIEKSYADHFGEPMDVINLTVKADNEEINIYKLYGDQYRLEQMPVELTDVTFKQDTEAGFWSWIGRLSDSGAVVDGPRGIRMRLRNIQIDGAEIVENLFSDIKPSYGRFTYYYVGEIHIDPARVIPNARRDGFEETDEWMECKSVIKEILLHPLRDDAYAASKRGTTDAAKIIEEIQDLAKSSKTLTAGNRATYDNVVDLMTRSKRLRKKAVAAQKRFDESARAAEGGTGRPPPSLAELEDATRAVEDIETSARMLLGQVVDDPSGKLDALKARIRRETLLEALEVVKLHVDSPTYQQIRRHLMRED